MSNEERAMMMYLAGLFVEVAGVAMIFSGLPAGVALLMCGGIVSFIFVRLCPEYK